MPNKSLGIKSPHLTYLILLNPLLVAMEICPGIELFCEIVTLRKLKKFAKLA